MKVSTFNYKRVYVWELAVRFFHWTTVLSLTVLVITGFIIANPPSFNLNTEPVHSYWFGYVRLIHFAFAYLLIANLLFRIYWAFAGNQFAKWYNFIPYTKKHWENIMHVLKYDILLLPKKDHRLSDLSVGHNALAAFAYFLMTLLFLIQAATGLALIADNSHWWFPKMFLWVKDWLGGDIPTRYIHHLFTWFFMLFVIVHVYLVLFHDYLEARGEASAMISGFKFVRAERIKAFSLNLFKKKHEEKNGENKEEKAGD